MALMLSVFPWQLDNDWLNFWMFQIPDRAYGWSGGVVTNASTDSCSCFCSKQAFKSFVGLSSIKKKSNIILLQPCRLKKLFFVFFAASCLCMKSLFEIIMLPFFELLRVIRHFNCEIQKQK